MIRGLFVFLTAFFAAFCASAARVDTITVPTSNLPEPMQVVVVTPDVADATQSYPSVYLLHGYGGRYDNWIKQAPWLGTLADLHGMVIVMPDGRDTWYWDLPEDTAMKMESFFTEDLVAFVDSHFPTLRDPRSRAVTGLSMGGHGALRLAAMHPDIWAHAGSMSGAVDLRPFAGRWNLEKCLGKKDVNPERWEEMTVMGLVPRFKDAGLDIVFDCGTSDMFHDVNAALHRTFLEQGVPHVYTSRPGTHNWDYWRESVRHHLLHFSQKLARGGDE